VRLYIGPIIAVWTAVLLAAAGPAALAQDTRLKEVERALEQDRAKAQALSRKAQALKDEIKTLRRDMVAAARAAQDLEEALSATEQALAGLEAERAEKQAALQAQRGRLVRTLGALQRIALRPPEVAFVAPGSPVDTLRSAMLLSVAVPVIERRGQTLQAELVALDGLRREIALKQGSLAAETQGLEDERERLARLIERKRGLENVTSAEQRAARARVRKLAREAKDLRDLVAKLERDAQERAEKDAREIAARQAREAAESAARESSEQTTDATKPPPRETQQAQLAAPLPKRLLEKPGNVRDFPRSPALSALVMPRSSRPTTAGSAMRAYSAGTVRS
jgi:septal ring factor EnvC (AmiA/AmiB activator)